MTRYRVQRPDGETIVFDSNSVVTHARFIYLDWKNTNSAWIMSKHRSEKAAQTGANQSPAWNQFARHVIATEIV